MSSGQPEIVLVESDQVLAEVTAFRLELAGYRVHTFSNTGQALQAVKQKPPALVIVDLRVTEGSAYELMELLGLDETTASVPILVMSTDAELDTVQKAFRAGAADYLVVPYDPLVLESKVEALVQVVHAG
jgi:DNA-binding response OmpR family regulator